MTATFVHPTAWQVVPTALLRPLHVFDKVIVTEIIQHSESTDFQSRDVMADATDVVFDTILKSSAVGVGWTVSRTEPILSLSSIGDYCQAERK